MLLVFSALPFCPAAGVVRAILTEAAPATGVLDNTDKGAPTDVPFTPTAIVLDVNALSSTARPLACAAPSAETLISRLTIVPFCVVPFSTAAGCGWSAGGAFSAGTGMMPSAAREASEDAGS